jgi:hypothetical protein
MAARSTTIVPHSPSRAWGLVGASWAVLGISALLLGGVFSMGPYALELRWSELSGFQRAGSLGFLIFMVFGKGYMGFYRGFAPRAARRVRELAESPGRVRGLLAPLFGMSLIQAPARRLLRSWGLMVAVASIVPVVRNLPDPWRGIVDAGVVAGLSVGLLSFWWFALLRPLLIARKKHSQT